MALSTRIILDNVTGKTPLSDTSFSVMYTPMDSGEFLDMDKDSVSSILVLAYEILPFILALAINNTLEKEEATIELIMKRLGVQKSVLVTRDLVSGLVFCLFWVLIYSVVFWAVLFRGKLGLGLILLFGILHAIQVILRQIIFNRIFSGLVAMIATLAMFLLQVSLSPIVIGYAVPSPFLARLGCIIGPMLQLNLLFHLGIVQ